MKENAQVKLHFGDYCSIWEISCSRYISAVAVQTPINQLPLKAEHITTRLPSLSNYQRHSFQEDLRIQIPQIQRYALLPIRCPQLNTAFPSLIIRYDPQLTLVPIETSIVRISACLRRGVVHGAGVLGILINSVSTLVLWKKLLHFPIALLSADREFKVFSRNGVPIL